MADGFICGKCVGKCSEHILSDIRKRTIEEIRQHLDYRTENRNSERFRQFSPDITLGKYEILSIDTVHHLWSLKMDKPFLRNDNPDIFYLSQITDIRTEIKKECINSFERFNGKLSRVPTRLRRKINRTPLYGYWFYILIEVHHEMFHTLKMRINRYIITDWNKDTYRSTIKLTKEIADKLKELTKKAGQS